MTLRLFLSLLFALCSFENSFAARPQKTEEQRSYLRIVGSSTVSPFMSAVAEEFNRSRIEKNPLSKTPLVESIGTKAGFQIFCAGVGFDYPDFASASRPIAQDELEICRKNGVTEIGQIKIGYDGIVIADLKDRKKINLNKQQIFLALAEKIYDEKTARLIANPYKQWSEIDSSLPQSKIVIYGPPASSGTRDVFIDMVMEDVCMQNHGFITNYPEHSSRKMQCRKIRSDGAFIESGENDALIIQNLKDNPDAFGIFGFNFLARNRDVIQAAKINDVEPEARTIASKKYQLSRPLFVYFKKANLFLLPEMKDFIREIINAQTIGKKGYLVHSGLVAMGDVELELVRKKVLEQLQ